MTEPMMSTTEEMGRWISRDAGGYFISLWRPVQARMYGRKEIRLYPLVLVQKDGEAVGDPLFAPIDENYVRINGIEMNELDSEYFYGLII